MHPCLHVLGEGKMQESRTLCEIFIHKIINDISTKDLYVSKIQYDKPTILRTCMIVKLQ